MTAPSVPAQLLSAPGQGSTVISMTKFCNLILKGGLVVVLVVVIPSISSTTSSSSSRPFHEQGLLLQFVLNRPNTFEICSGHKAANYLPLFIS